MRTKILTAILTAIASLVFFLTGDQVFTNWVSFPITNETEVTWEEFHAEAVAEYEDEFTALFNSYETKWSKNGRLMMRAGNSGSYRFVAKGK